MKALRLWLIVVFLSGMLPRNGAAQSTKRFNVWYFGLGAGLNFNGGGPSVLTDGRAGTSEGAATICDLNGALLFYSDGIRVYNRNHQMMPNGDNMGGHASSTQGALIVPHPGDKNLYYLFTVGVRSEGSAQYALIDMRLNGGLGGVVNRDNVLLSRSTEKLTAVMHCNERDYWVIMHEAGNNTFRTYLVDDKGVSTSPVISQVGAVYNASTDGIGYIRPSHDRRKLAAAVYDQGILDLFNFDNTNGRISNPISISDKKNLYGLEFSPDNNLLYVTFAGTDFNLHRIEQFDVSNFNQSTIAASATVVGRVQRTGNTQHPVGSILLAPDGKLYIAKENKQTLSVINSPNVRGVGCNFVLDAIPMGKSIRLALPNNVRLIDPEQCEVAVRQTGSGCASVELKAEVTKSQAPEFEYQWFRNNAPISGANAATYKTTGPGSYLVRVKEKGQCFGDTARSQPVEVKGGLNVEPKATANGCGKFILSANAGTGVNILWTGPGISGPRATQDTIHVSGTSGTVTYKVKVSSPTDPGCSVEKDLPVTFSAPPPYRYGTASQTACGSELLLDAKATAEWNKFTWTRPDGTTSEGPTLTARTSGTYRILARSADGACEVRDQVTVTLNAGIPAAPTVAAVSPICQGEFVPVLRATGANIRWYRDAALTQQVGTGNDFTPNISTQQPDAFRFYLTQRSGDDCVSPPAQVDVVIRPGVQLQVSIRNQAVCFASQPGPVRLSVGANPDWRYSWTEAGGSTLLGTQPTLDVTRPGQYVVQATTGQGCADTDTLTVTETCTAGVYVPSAFSPNGDGLNDRFELKGSFIGSFELTVFNRWGNAVFRLEGTDPSTMQEQFWDGTQGGQPLPTGVYAYKLIIRSEPTPGNTGGSDPVPFTRTGQVTLIR